ncbi:hypothetical protein AAA542_29520, partial [Pseudomonas aeruginosa]
VQGGRLHHIFIPPTARTVKNRLGPRTATPQGIVFEIFGDIGQGVLAGTHELQGIEGSHL